MHACSRLMAALAALISSTSVVLAALVGLEQPGVVGRGAALTASGCPSPPKSFLQRVADALDDPWWEDEFDKGDPLAPALVTASHAARAAADLQGQKCVPDPPARIAEHREQTALVRCLFGNPFRPRPVCAAWLTREVRALAAGIYVERAFDRMPSLADALDARGCANADRVEHCRWGGEPARGCGVVDLLLDRGGAQVCWPASEAHGGPADFGQPLGPDGPVLLLSHR